MEQLSVVGASCQGDTAAGRGADTTVTDSTTGIGGERLTGSCAGTIWTATGLISISSAKTTIWTLNLTMLGSVVTTLAYMGVRAGRECALMTKRWSVTFKALSWA